MLDNERANFQQWKSAKCFLTCMYMYDSVWAIYYTLNFWLQHLIHFQEISENYYVLYLEVKESNPGTCTTSLTICIYRRTKSSHHIVKHDCVTHGWVSERSGCWWYNCDFGPKSCIFHFANFNYKVEFDQVFEWKHYTSDIHHLCCDSQEFSHKF